MHLPVSCCVHGSCKAAIKLKASASCSRDPAAQQPVRLLLLFNVKDSSLPGLAGGQHGAAPVQQAQHVQQQAPAAPVAQQHEQNAAGQQLAAMEEGLASAGPGLQGPTPSWQLVQPAAPASPAAASDAQEAGFALDTFSGGQQLQLAPDEVWCAANSLHAVNACWDNQRLRA